jgi:diguanylate cyclase (GGDEF)-like protein
VVGGRHNSVRTSRRSLSNGIEQHDRRGRAAQDADGVDGALVIVVDGIQRIEELHGPAALSEVLRVAGQRIRLTLRCDDFHARWGAEELVVVVRNVTIDRVVEVGQRIRMAVSQPVLLHDGSSIVPTCAIGAAAGDASSTDLVIERARLALELAKGFGGNCVRRALSGEDRLTSGAVAG